MATFMRILVRICYYKASFFFIVLAIFRSLISLISRPILAPFMKDNICVLTPTYSFSSKGRKKRGNMAKRSI